MDINMLIMDYFDCSFGLEYNLQQEKSLECVLTYYSA